MAFDFGFGGGGGWQGGVWNERYPGGGSSTQLPGGFGLPGGGGGFNLPKFGSPGVQYGVGAGLGSLANVLQAIASNNVRMVSLPPPNAVFPGLNLQFQGGMGQFGPQSLQTLQQMSQTGMPVDY